MTHHAPHPSARPPRQKREGCVSSIAHISLSQPPHIKVAPEIAWEREQALADLLEESVFHLKDSAFASYRLNLEIEEDRFIMLINKDKEEKIERIGLSLHPVKKTVHDYFLLCEQFHKESKNGQSSRLETLDSGRRGIHNEGADWLLKRLASKITMDHATARRLFTLICVLHIRCSLTFKKTTRGTSDDV